MSRPSDEVEDKAGLSADADAELPRKMAEQIMIQSVALAMLNAVADQQRRAMLRNALATVAAKGALESDPKEALRLFDQLAASDDIVSTMTGLQKLMDELTGRAFDTNQGEPK